MAAGQEDAPAYLTLGPILTREYEEATEPWRKSAILTIAKQMHRNVIMRMERSGIPLHFPMMLGGWGLPGKPSAPPKFRKLAAIVLNGQSSIASKLHAVFLTSKAPKGLRQKIRKGLDTIQGWPEHFNEQSAPMNISEASREYTSRFLGFHGKDPSKSKLMKLKYIDIGTLSKRIFATVDQAIKLWPSAKPCRHSKATDISRLYESKMVDTQYMDLLLSRQGIFDTTVRVILRGDNQTRFTFEDEAKLAVMKTDTSNDVTAPLSPSHDASHGLDDENFDQSIPLGLTTTLKRPQESTFEDLEGIRRMVEAHLPPPANKAKEEERATRARPPRSLLLRTAIGQGAKESSKANNPRRGRDVVATTDLSLNTTSSYLEPAKTKSETKSKTSRSQSDAVTRRRSNRQAASRKTDQGEKKSSSVGFFF
jgi:hypothetical protein